MEIIDGVQYRPRTKLLLNFYKKMEMHETVRPSGRLLLTENSAKRSIQLCDSQKNTHELIK